MNMSNLTETEFLNELKKRLPYPNEMSDVELEIALRDFHDGLDIEDIANHLIWNN